MCVCVCVSCGAAGPAVRWAGITCLWLMFMDGLRYSPTGLPWWFAIPKVTFALAFFAAQAMLQVGITCAAHEIVRVWLL